MVPSENEFDTPALHKQGNSLPQSIFTSIFKYSLVRDSYHCERLNNSESASAPQHRVWTDSHSQMGVSEFLRFPFSREPGTAMRAVVRERGCLVLGLSGMN